MGDSQRILVVAGARALSRTSAARLWALAEIATAMHAHRVTAVCHGACLASPDEWTGDLARLARVTIIGWPLTVNKARIWTPGTVPRDLRDGDRYTYEGPHPRNAAMARWAGDRLRAGDDVRGLTLRCDWPMTDGRATQGTAHARSELVRALGAERVVDLVCPREFGPTTDAGR